MTKSLIILYKQNQKRKLFYFTSRVFHSPSDHLQKEEKNRKTKKVIWFLGENVYVPQTTPKVPLLITLGKLILGVLL